MKGKGRDARDTNNPPDQLGKRDHRGRLRNHVLFGVVFSLDGYKLFQAIINNEHILFSTGRHSGGRTLF